MRCGMIVKDDGAVAPRFHDSEVAALAFWLQEMLKRRGFLDAAGNQVPAGVLARRQSQDVAAAMVVEQESSAPPMAYKLRCQIANATMPFTRGYWLTLASNTSTESKSLSLSK